MCCRLNPRASGLLAQKITYMFDSTQRVLVTDFDGTMTKNDFYNLVVSDLLPNETPDYWVEYREGQITHFEALRR